MSRIFVKNLPKQNKKHKKKVKESQDRNEKSKVEDFPKELKQDPKFLEFLEVNKYGKQMPVWCDAFSEIKDENEEESSNKSSEGVKDSDDEEENISSLKRSMSDIEYLKSKMKTSDESSSKNIPPGTKLEKTQVPQSKTEKSYDDQFTVKLTHLPCSCKKGQIKQFFHPLKLASLRIPPRNKGFAYVKFKSDKDMNIALNKNKSFLNGQMIGVMKYIQRRVQYPSATNSVENKREEQVAAIAETGRIFVRNLCFSVKEEELRTLFSKYGPIAELHIPVDHYTKEHIGLAFVTYVLPENAVKAFTELDGSDFQGRLMHLIASKPKPEIRNSTNKSSFKDKKNAKLNTLSKSSHNWNTLFLGMNAVADAISEKHSISKAVLLDNETKDSLPVRMAQAETQLVMETRDFLLRHGVKLDTFSQPAAERSKVVLIVKDLPANTSPKELNELFSKHGVVSRVILPPSAITALVEFQDEEGAKTAYRKLCYRKFHYLPLFLEWAPMNIFDPELTEHAENQDQIEEKKVEAEEEIEYEPEEGTTLFVKNLNFNTTEKTLKRHFKKCGPLHSVSITRKNTNSGNMLSMGFGFVQFRQKSSASTAFLDLQSSELDGHRLELEFSRRATQHVTGIKRKEVQSKEQTGTKILVRNIPFEASRKEIKQLFQEYGDLKTVKLPTKSSGDGGHRGFGFVDFVTKTAAKRAFEVLCHSTHLLGRRLVLEWADTDTDDVSEQRKKTARDFYSGHAEKRVKKAKLMEDVLLSSTTPTEN